jgi:hypothetical protein
MIKYTVINYKDTNDGFEVNLLLLIQIICAIIQCQEDKDIEYAEEYPVFVVTVSGINLEFGCLFIK